MFKADLIRADSGDITVKVSGQLDVLAASQLTPISERLSAEKRPAVRLDLEDLELIDSSGVAAIVTLFRRIKAAGGTMTVIGIRNQPEAIFKLLRLDTVFNS